MPKDIEDVGFVSCAIKLMGVPGPKVLDDEKFTQDFISVCTPTFVTPDINANALLQAHVLRGTPVFYFFTTGFSHFLDFLMQGLWNETQTSPLEARYWSCVPYLLGHGQAMMYSVRPKAKTRSRIANLPFGTPSDNYLREAMIKTLVGNGRRIRFPGAGTDRSAPDADRGCRRSLAREAFAVRAGRNAANSEADIRLRRHNSRLRTTCPTRPGIACPSIVRWAIRAARASGCISSFATFASE